MCVCGGVREYEYEVCGLYMYGYMGVHVGVERCVRVCVCVCVCVVCSVESVFSVYRCVCQCTN